MRFIMISFRNWLDQHDQLTVMLFRKMDILTRRYSKLGGQTKSLSRVFKRLCIVDDDFGREIVHLTTIKRIQSVRDKSVIESWIEWWWWAEDRKTKSAAASCLA